MKSLYIIRHAKSSWNEPYKSDFDRTLNKRGFRDAPRMAKFLKDTIGKIDCIYSSPAERALQTSKFFIKELNPNEALYNKEIYDASLSTLHRIVENFSDVYKSAIIVGHNPGLNQLANYYVNEFRSHLPTCAIVGIDFEIESWKMVSSNLGTLNLIKVPKEL